jgi:hypothetical protein
MKLEISTIDRYIDAKEYIDTAILPVIRLDLSESMKNSLQQSTALLTLLTYIEEQLQGRVMLLPMLTYIEKDSGMLSIQITEYTDYIKKHGFEHVVIASFEEIYENKIISFSAEQLILSKYVDEISELNEGAIRQKGEDMLSVFMNLWQKG